MAPGQLSPTVGSNQLTTPLQRPASFGCDMFDGQPEITGSSSSVTVTLKEQVAALLEASVAV